MSKLTSARRRRKTAHVDEALLARRAAAAMSATQAPPSVAPSGEEAIHRTVDAEPQAFVDSEVPLDEAYEVDLTLSEIDKGGYQRVRSPQYFLKPAERSRADGRFERTDCTPVR